MNVRNCLVRYADYADCSVQILAAARLKIMPNPVGISAATDTLPPLYAGQPISITLSITTSFHWAPSEESIEKTYIMKFDVEEITKDWLVSGKKKADFVAKVRHRCSFLFLHRRLIFLL